MKNRKILFLDTVHPDLPLMLKEIGFETDISEIDNEHDLIEKIPGYFGLIVRSAPKINRLVIEKGEDLRFIARAGSGIESIDYEFAMKKGITVLHSPEGNSNAVGEHALALTLCLLRKITSASAEVKCGLWLREENRGNELMGLTAGIIGYGNTGMAFAGKLSGMGVEILAYDKYKTGFSDQFVSEATLDDILQMSDIISFHVPLTEETIHYGNKSFFQKCAKSVMILNTSRGKVVSTVDLCEAIQSGKVFAAGLDVVEEESFDFNLNQIQQNAQYKSLLSMPNVIITPHIAGITHESRLKHARVLFEKIRELVAV